jgi:epoxyqueuosine reductase
MLAAKIKLSSEIKTLALSFGFMTAGITRVRPLTEEVVPYEQWLQAGYAGDMKYLANHKELRYDPRQLVPGAQSIICLAYSYFPEGYQTNPSAKIARYAQGKDYHKVLKKKLKSFWLALRNDLAPHAQGRYFVDSAPVMERHWARLAGLGWIGKNSLLIHPKKGSYFFLAEVISNLDLVEDEPIEDHCGTCTRCIDACPTDAIDENGYLLKANQCISYHTIESEDLADDPTVYSSNWVFGCDICQEVCPWNRFSTPHQDPELNPLEPIQNLSRQDWLAMEEDDFQRLFSQSALRRAGLPKLQAIIRKMNETQTSPDLSK